MTHLRRHVLIKKKCIQQGVKHTGEIKKKQIPKSIKTNMTNEYGRISLTKSVMVNYTYDVQNNGPDEIIKINKIIYLESNNPYNFMGMLCHKIIKLNMMDIDKLDSVKNINCVVIKDNNLSYINKIIKFCDITMLPIKICVSKIDDANIVINKINIYDKNIKYTINDEFNIL